MQERRHSEQDKYKVLAVLSRHPGPGRAISMPDLYRAVYGGDPRTRINGTRKLRSLITQLRKEGVAVGSTATRSGGGYYLATAGSDLADYCRRLRSQGLKKLALEAKIRKTTLHKLVGEIQLNLQAEVPHD
ncbi:helix-turn-helix domain-containing protein [Desulfonatronovibrio hydrogenovorans]|uniref:helix-turn-helix domain-containing protein n=1 Tax=Desulfonatronovibrio hydrogenovorans TaxID=53245 RepID=UPI00068A3002|nr:helix-turn-helix domain-containing protein [Desulfonatronovibrio hydrogenovorans]